MLKILGKPTSINVRKVLWLCEELGAPFELEPYGSGFRTTDTPEFRALNPNALVPVLLDGEAVLWESNTICRYLAGKHGRDDLLPREPLERARVEQWMDWQATDLNFSWRYAFPALVRNTPPQPDPQALQAGIDGWNRHMAILDGHLRQAGDWPALGRFTLADIVLGLSVHRWFMTPMARPALAAVAAYYERLSQRPAVLRHGRNGTP
jgi:glutathione S-transferase